MWERWEFGAVDSRLTATRYLGPVPAAVPRVLTKARKLCLALPEAHEVLAWGEPTFRVRNKMFAMYAHASNHHGGGRHALWLKCTPTNQQLLVAAEPGRFFVPPYVGPSGWVGVGLDGTPDWAAIGDLVCDAYLAVAPPPLKARLREPR